MFKKSLYFLVFLLAALLLCACKTTREPKDIAYVKQEQVPSKIAVMPAVLKSEKDKNASMEIKAGSEKAKFVTNLVRGVVNNQLSGKGYVTKPLQQIDEQLNATNRPWPKMDPKKLCKLLKVNGLIYPKISSATMVKAIVYNKYALEAALKLVNSRGEELGTWTESASKRQISVPTGALSAAATVAKAALDEPARKHMRLTVYDWGWKISQLLPKSTRQKELPEVLLVSSNVDKQTFAAGQNIKVQVDAEKGLSCTFDLGDFKKGIALPESSPGTYKGFYEVRKGQQTSAQPLIIHLEKPNGVQRTWQEAGGTINIDAVPPQAPRNLQTQSGKQGISLTWSAPGARDVQGFLIQKGDKPFGNFTELARTADLNYLDAEVKQGKTYYYRVRALDQVENESASTKKQKAVMPQFEQVTLEQTLQGNLVPGQYLARGQCLIPEGQTLNISPGTRIKFSKGAKIIAKGVLKARGKEDRPLIFEGQNWQGIQVTAQGQARIAKADFYNCSPCLKAHNGFLSANSSSFNGPAELAIDLQKQSRFTLSGLSITGFQQAILQNGGRGKILKNNITENQVGLKFLAGSLEIRNNNIYENSEQQIVARKKLILEDNYLGTDNADQAKLKGDILVASLLDAPYPHGRRISLLSDKEITPEAIKSNFEKHKKQGIKSFKDKKFGAAYQDLNAALRLKKDPEVYLYLAYTQMILEEGDKLEKTLKQGIEDFPYEVKLYKVYARHLLSSNQEKKALKLISKALKMNPDSESLKTFQHKLTATEPVRTAEKGALQANSTEQARTNLKKQPDQGQEPYFEELKTQGIQAFKNRDLQKAADHLQKALKKRKDKKVYLYLAYTRMQQNNSPELEKVMEKAINHFPEEVRLYQLYAKHLSAKGAKEKALELVNKGLQISPANQQLQFMKTHLQNNS